MRHRLIIPIIWLALVSSARAMSVELPVSPESLDQSHYRFSVATNPTNQGIAFHITILAKKDEIASDSHADVSIVSHTKDSQGSPTGTTIGPMTPTIPLALNKDKHTWTADFTVSRDALKTPGLCFVFTELSHTTIDGKLIAMPSATFYEMKLTDFVKE
jgi:hypothetical protein